VQPGRGQLHLEARDEASRPRLPLLEVVHRDDGPLHQDGHAIAEFLPRISSGRLPASIAGLMISASQNADSVSAIRRSASPWTDQARNVE
jgi:hypothetical protein